MFSSDRETEEQSIRPRFIDEEVFVMRITSLLIIFGVILTGMIWGQSGGYPGHIFPRYSERPIPTGSFQNATLPDLGLTAISTSIHPGHLYDLAYHGGRLALANGWQRYGGNFLLFDASMPDSIALMSSYSLDFNGGAIRVAMNDEIALVSVVGEGFIVLDITDPTDISYLGGMETVPSINEMVLVGDIAYMALMNTGLVIVDLTDPSAPVMKGMYRSGNPSLSLTVSDHHVYVADGAEGLSVYDVEDPGNPVLINTIPEGDVVLQNVTSRGELLAVMYRSVMINTGGFILYDISIPTSPAKVSDQSIFGVEVFPATDLELRDRILMFAAGQTGFQVYDVSDPHRPERMGGFGGGAPPNAQFVSWPSRIAVGKHNVFTTCPDWFYVPSENEIQVIDLSDPYEPRVVSSWDTPSSVRNSVVVDNLAYLAANHDGLIVQDITDPFNPVYLSRTWSAGDEGFITGSALEVKDGIVYIVGGGQSLTTIDVSDPVEPLILGLYDENGYASDIVTSKGYSLVTHYEIFPENGWVSVVNVEDPQNPVRTGVYYTGSLTFGVDYQGSYAYLACRDGIQVVDVSDPYHPSGLGFANTGVGCYDLVVAGSYAYAVDEITGLNIIDISDPSNPFVVSSLETPGTSKDIALHGDRAYIADYDGIVTVDISNPFMPTLLGRKGTWGIAVGVSTVPGKVFLGDSFGWDIFGILTP
jgi:hypothetical protein